MKSLYILLLAIAVLAVSCRTKDGAPGPAGENTLTQNGHISGTVTFKKVNDTTTFRSTFNYQYFESLADNRFYVNESGSPATYEMTLSRRAAGDSANSCTFRIGGLYDLTTGIEDDPLFKEADFYFATMFNGELYEFNEFNTTITNLQLNPTTGRLTFNFISNMNYSNGIATVAGTVDVSAYRVYHSIVNWL